jgi:hypothetical protein
MNAWNLFVFRKAREELSTRSLIAELQNEIRYSISADALVRAGEIETGLADCGSAGAPAMAAIVDDLARALCGAHQPDRSRLDAALEQLDGPASIQCGHTEGFSFYGLHPLDFADLVAKVSKGLAPDVAILGIRSAGAALSAVVQAALQSQGKKAERTTVRPEGEPYQRRTIFTAAQLAWVREKLSQNADFAVVDEGPGFSGSTFLSVVNALVAAGVPHAQIVLLGSRPFNEVKRGISGSAQWRTCNIAYGMRGPSQAKTYIGNGFWRQHLYPELSHWPACWTEMERAKHLSADGRCFLKFEGFGRYGERCRQQATVLAAEKFSPVLSGFDSGFAAYEFVQGRPMRQEDVTPALLSHIARYCAFRVRNFPAPDASVDTRSLSNMLRRNLSLLHGRELETVSIPVEYPVYADCSMRPHEWLLTREGHVLKTDAVGHAEGHLLPGPVDIAWDLAGTIMEWRLTPTQTEFFLGEYFRQSGDDVRHRLEAYLLLYSAFRMAFCSMGASSMAAWRESKYLRRDCEWYASLAQELYAL